MKIQKPETIWLATVRAALSDIFRPRSDFKLQPGLLLGASGKLKYHAAFSNV